MNKKIKTLVFASGLVALVIAGSYASSKLWGGKPEGIASDRELFIEEGMTAAEFAGLNGIPEKVIVKALALKSAGDTGARLDSLGLGTEEIAARVQGALAIYNEDSSKNWKKIAVKFALWLFFLGAVFYLLVRGKAGGPARNWLYFAAALIFGVALGSDPSPMGTVKDAIVLYGAKGVIFPPRMMALAVFLLTVVLANKFICSWGCQLGVLQDLLFRFGRGLRQVRPSFLVTNTVRVLFFAGLTAAAAVWGLDIVEGVDPFKIYNPAVLTAAGWLFLAVLLVSSVFIYRPWCHFFCPFGLVGWLFEKLSVYKIKVEYSTCIACGACERACPSTVMGAILKRDRIVPDCFACGECMEKCPTGSISFSAGKRGLPPAGKFSRK